MQNSTDRSMYSVMWQCWKYKHLNTNGASAHIDKQYNNTHRHILYSWSSVKNDFWRTYYSCATLSVLYFAHTSCNKVMVMYMLFIYTPPFPLSWKRWMVSCYFLFALPSLPVTSFHIIHKCFPFNRWQKCLINLLLVSPMASPSCNKHSLQYLINSSVVIILKCQCCFANQSSPPSRSAP